MTPPPPPWRVTYTPGEWLVLAGPAMLVVMLPAPPRMSGLVNTLWDDISAAESVEALLKVFGEYGLDAMTDFAAFFWDAAGLHGMARGELGVVDADTGEIVLSGPDVVTWREEPFGTVRNLRVGMQQINDDEHLRLPLVVGAALASTIHLSTDPESRAQFPEGREEESGISGAAEVVGLGAETEMEPFAGSSLDDDIPMWTPPADDTAHLERSPAISAPAAASVDAPQTPVEVYPQPADQGPQVLAVPCAHGHPNPPGTQNCRICSAPVDAGDARLIGQPALAGVHTNRGAFVDVREGVVIGRSPDALKGPKGADVLRVPSPSSDISRSHLVVTTRNWDIIVTDLGSTNGSTVIPPGEQSFVLAHGESVAVELGTVLDLGDGVSLRIEPPRG